MAAAVASHRESEATSRGHLGDLTLIRILNRRKQRRARLERMLSLAESHRMLLQVRPRHSHTHHDHSPCIQHGKAKHVSYSLAQWRHARRLERFEQLASLAMIKAPRPPLDHPGPFSPAPSTAGSKQSHPGPPQRARPVAWLGRVQDPVCRSGGKGLPAALFPSGIMGRRFTTLTTDANPT